MNGNLNRDAACRVVIWPSRLPPMGTDGLYHDAAPLGRALAALGTAPTKDATASLANE